MKKNLTSLFLKNIYRWGCAIVALSLLVACGTQERVQSEPVEVQEGIDINQDPVAAIQKILELGQKGVESDAETRETSAIEPISFQELLGYLPEAPRGWKAEKPQGHTSSFGGYSISQVKQKYSQQDRTMTVSIFDWAFNSALYTPFLLSTEFSQESTEGYNKGIKIDDIPGRETYDYNSKNGSLNLLINRRFLVQIDGNNIEEQELRGWWSRLDRDSLAKNYDKQQK